MAMLDLLEFFDPTGEIMLVKMPQEGSAEFRTGSQLVVQESQVAVVYRDGKALDGFLPGRHTLSTRNLPMLARLIGLPFGKSPYRCYVYFLATKTFTSLGWGTPKPIPLRDTDFGYVNLRAFGSYAIRIVKPRTFLNTIVGTRGKQTTFALQGYLRTMIVSRAAQVIAKHMEGKSLFDLPLVFDKIAVDVKDMVKQDFDQYGLRLVDLLVEAITPPPEVQEAIDQRSGMQVQNMERLKVIRQLDALNTAAANEGQAGGAMGTGMGLGMGMAMANQMVPLVGGMTGGATGPGGAGGPGGGGSGGGPPPLPKQPCPDCNAANPMGAKFCCACGIALEGDAESAEQQCDKCGHGLPKDAKFCPNCGDTVIACPACGADNPEGVSSCVVCGEPMPVACPHCEQTILADARFCRHCGKAMGDGDDLPGLEGAEMEIAPE